ncbi:signal peptidase I [Cellulomonas sp.]|uniref:signal peptidase I n=1 Tax=Cellulomonas sp. TaxID=40001 RepID=UPI002D28FC52|nr:signal peptidase I [Cellulomonas sp.]HYQ76756.1 signal peptidase I [Cellulomonas sp.]
MTAAVERVTRRSLRAGGRGAAARGRGGTAGGRARRAGGRAARGLQQGVLDVAAVLGALSILAAVACLALGVRPAVVVSGSMAPGIPVGALTVARTVPAEQVAVGDVVTVPRTTGAGLVTHRVVEAAPAGDGRSTVLRLQGDANAEPDALPYTVTEVGQVLGSVPGVGYAVSWMQQHLLLVVAALLVVTALATAPFGRRRA